MSPSLPAELVDPIRRAVGEPPVYHKVNRYFDARVWRGRDGDGHPIAIKRVMAADPEVRACLYREHRFLLAAADRRVVRHRGHGRLGAAYLLVTDWVEGEPVDLAIGRLGPGEGEALRTACAGVLALLRERGVVHRDLRPTNLLVRADHLVVIDFGWAVWRDEAAPFTPPELAVPDDAVALSQLVASIPRGRVDCPLPTTRTGG